MINNRLFENKKLLVGITGGIAAYKVPEYIRMLIKNGAEVRAILTSAAEKFVTKLTLETITGTNCLVELFPQEKYYATHHIDWADWTDAFIVMPATANFIGKMAYGLADDLLSTVALAVTAPTIVAPAMNVHMWENKIVQNNIKILQSNDKIICPPAYGSLACGYSGYGRMAPYHHVQQYLRYALANKNLKGKKILITMGPTQEQIDPVRYISNYSSGKMGLQIALEGFCRGAEVTVISGPTSVDIPNGINWIDVNSAQEMANKVDDYFDTCDIFFSAAAVADYSPSQKASHKIKKQSGPLNINLESTIDILKRCGENKKADQKVFGFALESNEILKNGAQKLKSKNLDGIIINSAIQVDSGIGSDNNSAILLKKNGVQEEIPKKPKHLLSADIFDFFLNE